jgi:hypothetical protein
MVALEMNNILKKKKFKLNELNEIIDFNVLIKIKFFYKH